MGTDPFVPASVAHDPFDSSKPFGSDPFGSATRVSSQDPFAADPFAADPFAADPFATAPVNTNQAIMAHFHAATVAPTPVSKTKGVVSTTFDPFEEFTTP